MKFEGYDIIGDIHGEFWLLCDLLKKLGYSDNNFDCRFTHPTRKVIFLGDYIDRGECPLETVWLVRQMVECGSAIALMGNHEFNAIMAHDGFRKLPETDVHYRLHSFLKEKLPKLYDNMIDWFKTLPICFVADGLATVHACWDENLLSELREKGIITESNTINEWVYEKYNNDTSVRLPLKSMLKGKEEKLPKGITFIDKDGNVRNNRRIPWWETYEEKDLAFCGHYWMKADAPKILSDKVACVDYSACKGGFLCAYRYNVGDTSVKDDRFVWVNKGI